MSENEPGTKGDTNTGWEEPSELIIEQIEIGPMQNYTYIIGSRGDSRGGHC